MRIASRETKVDISIMDIGIVETLSEPIGNSYSDSSFGIVVIHAYRGHHVGPSPVRGPKVLN